MLEVELVNFHPRPGSQKLVDLCTMSLSDGIKTGISSFLTSS